MGNTQIVILKRIDNYNIILFKITIINVILCQVYIIIFPHQVWTRWNTDDYNNRKYII